MSNPLRRLIKKMLHSAKLDLIRYDINTSNDLVIQAVINHFNIKTIIDGGANAGQYAAKIFENGYAGKIYSFEPLQSVFEVLQKNALRFPQQWEAFKLALGSKEDELEINVTENLVSSSLLNVGKHSLDAEPTTRIIRKEKVKVVTLDSFLTGKYRIDTEALLKLDLQGFELEALKGSTNVLRQFKVIQAELSFVPVYDGAPLFKEMMAYFENKGYEFYSMAPVFSDGATGRLLQVDATFVRKD